MNDKQETICKPNSKSHVSEEDAFGSPFLDLKHIPSNAGVPVFATVHVFFFFNLSKGKRPIKQECITANGKNITSKSITNCYIEEQHDVSDE